MGEFTSLLDSVDTLPLDESGGLWAPDGRSSVLAPEAAIGSAPTGLPTPPLFPILVIGFGGVVERLVSHLDIEPVGLNDQFPGYPINDVGRSLPAEGEINDGPEAIIGLCQPSLSPLVPSASQMEFSVVFRPPTGSSRETMNCQTEGSSHCTVSEAFPGTTSLPKRKRSVVELSASPGHAGLASNTKNSFLDPGY